MLKILLPTDFSKNSTNAISYAMQFFTKWKCTFYILHVQKTSDYITGDLMAATPKTMVYKAVMKDSEKKLLELIETLKKTEFVKSYKFQPLVDFDSLTDAVKQTIKAHKIDLIVMGSNGASDAKEAFFGSNTLQLVRSIASPILIIPNNFQYKTIRNVLFSIQTKTIFLLKEVKILKEILVKYNAKLNVLLSMEQPNMAEEERLKNGIHNLFSEFNYQFNSIIGIPTSEAITSYEQLISIDLNAIFMDKEKFIDRLIFGSQNKLIAEESEIPLLVLSHSHSKDE